MIKKDNITGLILAGGRATRMGGKDKGLVEIAGQTLISRIADQLVNQVGSLIINANRHFDEYESAGYSVIRDQLADFQGPLAGILSGLESIDTDWMLTTPCDGPFVAHDYCEKMSAAAYREDVLLCVARDDQRLQPVYCLLHRSLAESLRTYLEAGERKIDRWYAQHRTAEVNFGEESPMFINVNTPEQLAQVEAELIACRG